MRGLLILSVLCHGLFSADPPFCKLNASEKADEAEYLINKLHHHGYKFKLFSYTEELNLPGLPACQTFMVLTLKETKCHIVNPKPFNECEERKDNETPVIAKCNVTLCDGGEKPGIAQLICDTEPASSEQLIRSCPDCPTLLPLHDPEGLESVKAAIEKFNKESNQTSYFKLLEVGRLSTQHNMKFGMSHFAEFAIVETECSDNVKNEEKPSCKQKCPNEAHHGFCKSTQLGNGDLTVNCEIYEVQNTTHHPHPPFHHGKHYVLFIKVLLIMEVHLIMEVLLIMEVHHIMGVLLIMESVENMAMTTRNHTLSPLEHHSKGCLMVNLPLQDLRNT
ncbi:hypothetical protein AMELA_G00138190 [Ameiurus melas]|uniref:Cystatin fetuin-A-type domain-containing protein n=1 Tax=Ameiurus melas TaxID=219545 RepID=A0A7J6AK25_AMEME|nr:hypothetical protein AMELA_G00138190 [Ameiurus melas]